MNDVTLKPRLLRSLLEYVPDEKHPFLNHADLSHIVSSLKTHQLLTEQCPHSTDQKVIDSWKSTVDAWVNRVLALASSNMPDKNWAGICLLGLTFQDCSAQRFLAHIQFGSTRSSHLSRLGEFNNAKKDGTSHATKAVQAILKLLDEDAYDVVWEEAVCLLCVVINTFPSSVGRYYDNVCISMFLLICSPNIQYWRAKVTSHVLSLEAAIVSKIMSENCSPRLLEKLGHALALLPKSKGDNDSWSLMITKILLSLNKQLNEVFQGLEEANRRDDAMKSLLPPGKEVVPPLGGIEKVSNRVLIRPEEFLISRASFKLSCCCTMLTSPYPVQVLVPVRPLIAIAKRVLLVDGSLSSNYGFMSVMRHELICSQIPVLHWHSLDLLIAIVIGLRSQVLPHVAYITQLSTEYFGACTLPELRIKLYSVVKVLLTSMGVGLAIYMTQDIVKNALMDLGDSQEEVGLPIKKKRKHSITSEDKSDENGIEVERSHNISAPIAVKIAALEVLEALLTVGGALRSNSWRPSVDSMLMTIASSACRGGWAREKSTVIRSSSDPPILVEFQLASLRALLGSLLSFCHIRPPHLAQALDLFQRGSEKYGTKIGEYCNHALLALEVLIHPRTFPLLDNQSVFDHHYKPDTNLPSSDSNIYSNSSRGGTGTRSSNGVVVDDLYEDWLGNGETIEEEAIVVTDHVKTAIENSNNNNTVNTMTDCRAHEPKKCIMDVGVGAPVVVEVISADKSRHMAVDTEVDDESLSGIVDGDPDSDY